MSPLPAPRGYGPDAAFCPRCAARLDSRPPTSCAACGYALYLNARPTASLVVVEGGRFLALKRAIEPKAGLWDLPGGFCDGFEHPTAAAVREAREELGVEITLGRFIGMYVGEYDFQGERLPVLDCFFLASLDGAEVTLDQSEVSDMSWFDLDDPPPLAFATMDAALAEAVRLVNA